MADMTTADTTTVDTTTGHTQAHRHDSRLISTLALVAAVIGAVISFLGWGILLPIAAIVLGAIGARREKRARGLWLSAILLGIVGLIVSAIFLFLQYLSLMALIGFSAA
ncbi:hypothetical protein BH11ACT2_BH11ACT2_10780 [soil metagenome]